MYERINRAVNNSAKAYCDEVITMLDNIFPTTQEVVMIDAMNEYDGYLCDAGTEQSPA